MITADFNEDSAPKGMNWSEAERIGKELGAFVIDPARQLEPLTPDRLAVEQKVFRVPLGNPRFAALVKLKVFPPELAPDGQIEPKSITFASAIASSSPSPARSCPTSAFISKAA